MLSEDLRLRVDLRETGETVLAWRDLSGDHGDLFEFVCDSATRPEVSAGFESLLSSDSSSASTSARIRRLLTRS